MRITGYIKIKNGKIKFLDKYLERVQSLASENEGKYGLLTFEIAEKAIQYHRHKYYRGFLLPPIADEAFGGNQRKAHIEMKRMFRYFPIMGLDEIPERYMGACIIEFDTIRTGDQVERVPVGYMPSMGDYTEKDAKDFILKVEAFAFSDLMVGIKEEDKEEALYHRNKGLGLETDQLKELEVK